MKLITPADIGANIQHNMILYSLEKSAVPDTMPAPKIAPTMACDVEHGRARYVKINMVRPAARAVKNALSDVKSESFPRAAKHFSPSNIAPNITNMEIRTIAVLYLIICAATPVPNMFAESLLPKVHPKNIPEIIFHILFIILLYNTKTKRRSLLPSS